MMKKLAALLAGSSVAVIAVASPAFAEDDEIVVTGSQIRGIAPAGVAVIGLGQDDIQSTGAATGNELLQEIPQALSYFGTTIGIGNNSATFAGRAPISRPILRPLPGQSTANSPMTLTLVDGHRMVPSGGPSVSGFDPDGIAPAMIQRLEIMPDGASAIYGSDTIAGVINYILRDSFDGAEISGHYGFAPENGYENRDLSATYGHDWGSGNAFISVFGSQRDALFGRDLSDIHATNYNPGYAPGFGLPNSFACAPGNLTYAGQPAPANPLNPQYSPISSAGVPQAITNSQNANRCDFSDWTAVVPRQEEYGGMIGFAQDLTDSLHFDVKFWAQRRVNWTYHNLWASGPYNQPGLTTPAVTISGSNPNYQPIPGVPGTPTQTLITQWTGMGYQGRERKALVDWYQITPRLTWDLGNDWQLRALTTYGESDSTSRENQLNQTALQAAINAGTINPYTQAGFTPALIASFISPIAPRDASFGFRDYMAVADGPLFELPGGTIHVAAGAERTVTDFTLVQPGQSAHDEVTVDSLFGELQVPIFGPGNAIPGFQSLFLSASVRSDSYDYNGFSTASGTTVPHGGGFETTNPSIGITWEPMDFLTLRATWGTSFTAPNGQNRVGTSTFSVNPANPSTTPQLPGQTVIAVDPVFTAGNGVTPGTPIYLALTGGSAPNLEPQESTNWSAGFDFRAPFLEGLTISATYWSIVGTQFLGSPGSLFGIINTYPHLYHYTGQPLTTTEINNLLAGSLGPNVATPGGTPYNPTYSACSQWDGIAAAGTPGYPTCPIAAWYENRTRNLQDIELTGLDFDVQYTRDTAWGAWDASIGGSHIYQIHNRSNGLDQIDVEAPLMRFVATLGTDVGAFRGQLSFNHIDGFDMLPGTAPNLAASPAVLGVAPYRLQDRIDPYEWVDLFFRYDLGAIGFTDSTSLTLNINNVFENTADLSYYDGSAGNFPGHFQGDFNGAALTPGRVFRLGFVSNF